MVELVASSGPAPLPVPVPSCETALAHPLMFELVFVFVFVLVFGPFQRNLERFVGAPLLSCPDAWTPPHSTIVDRRRYAQTDAGLLAAAVLKSAGRVGVDSRLALVFVVVVEIVFVIVMESE